MSGMPNARPLPYLYEDDLPFWEGARDGELRLPRCRGCSETWWPASPVCPRCLSDDVEWYATSGRGQLHSWVVFHKVYYGGLETPYNVAWVELEEGPRVTSRIVDAAPDQLRIGLPVEVVFERLTDEVTLPGFRPQPERRDRS